MKVSHEQQEQEEQEEAEMTAAAMSSTSIDWGRLQYATLTNLLGIEGIIRMNGSATTARRSLEFFSQSLSVFHSLLSEQLLTTYYAPRQESAVAGRSHSSSIMLRLSCSTAPAQAKMAAIHGPDSSQYYFFRYPISYYPSFSPHCDQQSSCTEWCIPISFHNLASFTIFNMALILHKHGMILATNNKDNFKNVSLKKASKLYGFALELFQQEPPESCWGGDTSSLRLLLQIASWNNLSHIYFHQQNWEESRLCLQRVAMLGERATPFPPATPTSANEAAATGRQDTLIRDSAVAQEMWSGALLNGCFLQKEEEKRVARPTPADAPP
jgi:hypothetical protein